MLLVWSSEHRAENLRHSASSARKSASVLDRVTATFRFLTSRQFHVHTAGWYAPPLEAIVAVAIMTIFVLALMLGPRPYYWAVMAMGDSPPIATRSAWIALGIMPFMIAFATKVNFIRMLAGTSHGKLQVFHRWSAVLMHIASVGHAFPFIVREIRAGTMVASWNTSSLYWTGVAALVPQTYLIALSLHFIAANIFMAALFIHVAFILTSWDYFFATAALYGTVWLARFLHLTRAGHPATITSAMPDLLAVRIPVPRGRRASTSSCVSAASARTR
ncbi:hypothetical protein FB451DRAFT_1443575 [Mycena latifolia]|nr:hypothetical protein FB451DRAFT_1443575 [Mycena latifolia]